MHFGQIATFILADLERRGEELTTVLAPPYKSSALLRVTPVSDILGELQVHSKNVVLSN